MKARRARTIISCLRRAASPEADLTDGQLLGQYLARRDGGAFASLVRRHGPMVLAVCRRVLRHAQDAEDAFQATFLVLAKKAASVADREAVAAWLHGVACRAAWQARASALRRARERQVAVMPQPIAPPEDDRRELLELLDRELARLPKQHRLPLVLCELEGRSRKEAARQLGLAEGTLSSRLARGRKMLARRMAAHGAAVAAASASVLLSGGARAACVPPALAVSTVGAAGGVVPAGVAALVKGVMKAMLLSKLKGAVWALLVVAAVSVGAATWTYRASAQPAPDPRPQTGASGSAGFTPAIGPGAAGAGFERDELEALRLELESLRLELKATKERVKALEERAQGPGGSSGFGPGSAPGFGPGGPGGGSPGRPGGRGAATPGSGAVPAGPGASGPPGAAGGGFTPLGDGLDPQDALQAAMQQLRQHPTDKQALDDLERAIQALKERAPEKPAAKRGGN